MDNSNPESSEFQFKCPTFIPTKSKKKSLNDTKGIKETVMKAMHTPISESNNTVQNIPKLALSSRKHVKINETYKFDQSSDLCAVSSIVSTKESVKMFDNFKFGENRPLSASTFVINTTNTNDSNKRIRTSSISSTCISSCSINGSEDSLLGN